MTRNVRYPDRTTLTYTIAHIHTHTHTHAANKQTYTLAVTVLLLSFSSGEVYTRVEKKKHYTRSLASLRVKNPHFDINQP